MNFLVIGAGELGYALVFDLIRSPKIERIFLVDPDAGKITKIMSRFVDERIVPCTIDFASDSEMVKLMSACKVAISTLQSARDYEFAKLALQAGCSFCDMGEDEEVSGMQFLLSDLAKEHKIALVPGCGMTPGMVSILAANALATMKPVYEIKIQVGLLPIEVNSSTLLPPPALPAERLLEEAFEEAVAIRNGTLVNLPALSEVETVVGLPPFTVLESFNTIGGIKRLATQLAGKVNTLSYKRVHIPGYCMQMQVLRDLGFLNTGPVEVESGSVSPRDLTKKLMSERQASREEPDAVLMRVTIYGAIDGQDTKRVWECFDYMDQANKLSAWSRLKAFPASVVAQMLARGDIKEKGTLAHEERVPIKLYLAELASRGIHISMTDEALGPEANH